MSIRRIPLFLLLLTLGTLLLMAGCESKPTAPAPDNPFDPDNPLVSDPFGLTATYNAGTITLLWRQLPEFNIDHYDVQHSSAYFGEYFSIGTFEGTSDTTGLFVWNDATPTTDHFFKVQAFDQAGNYTSTSLVAPAYVTTPALVVVGEDNARQVSSRNIVLNIFVTEGDSLRLSQDGVPTSETVVAAADSGVAMPVSWDLGAVAANDTTLHLNVVVQNGTSLGDTNKINLNVSFHPNLALSGGGTRVASRRPIFAISTEGLVSMRFASSEEDLALQDWIPALPSYQFNQLEDTTAPQTVYAEFLSDFGFSIIDEITLTADLLADPGFYLALPEDHLTDQRTVTGVCNAVATQMRFHESLDFNGIDWQAYQDTIGITLSEGPGQKVVYAQFRNDFAQSGILSDFAVYLSQPVAIAFTAPAPGDTLVGGTTLALLGTTTAPSGVAPVDSVKLDTGEGWVDTWGTSIWRYVWASPEVDVVTRLDLRARAWAAGDSATTTLPLTLIPR